MDAASWSRIKPSRIKSNPMQINAQCKSKFDRNSMVLLSYYFRVPEILANTEVSSDASVVSTTYYPDESQFHAHFPKIAIATMPE